MKSVHGARAKSSTVVLYGASGVGKTTLAATAPLPLILDSNQGTLSIDGRPGYEHVKHEEITHTRTLEKAYENFLGTGTKNWKKLFESIVFDHFDDIQALTLDELGQRRKERDERANVDEVEQREWGIMGNRLRRYVRKFKAVPVHKILICGEKEDRETGRMKPSLQGALQAQLPYLADHTMYLRIGKNGQRYLHLDSTDDFYAKTRAWWMPPDERKIKVDFNDPKFLTTLFARLAAGPKGTTTRREK